MPRTLTVTKDLPSIGIKTGVYSPGEIPKARAMWLVSRGHAHWSETAAAAKPAAKKDA